MVFNPVRAQANVIGNGAGEQERVLQHHAITPPQSVQVHVANIDAVNADGALLHVIKTQQQRDDGGLSRAGVANDGNRLAGLDGERHIAQHPVVLQREIAGSFDGGLEFFPLAGGFFRGLRQGAIGEPHVVKLDAPRSGGHLRRCGGDDLRCGIQQLEDALA